MKLSSALAIGILVAVTAGTARADIVIDWNLTTIELMKAAKVRPGSAPGLRALAMVHVAMSDAISPSTRQCLRDEDVTDRNNTV